MNEAAGQLRSKLKRPVSVDEVLEALLRERNLRPSDFAGSWSMSESELKEFERGLKTAWKSWKLPAK